MIPVYTHDVAFKTSDGGSVSADRVIVAAGSPVFHTMLHGNMKESSQKEIELLNMNSSILNKVLSSSTLAVLRRTLQRVSSCYKLQIISTLVPLNQHVLRLLMSL